MSRFSEMAVSMTAFQTGCYRRFMYVDVEFWIPQDFIPDRINVLTSAGSLYCEI